MSHSDVQLTIPRTSISTGAPLSFAQQRLWFLDQFEPQSALYNTPVVVELDGPLDIEALRLSFERIVCRHEALRTVFPSRAGAPYQHVLDPQPFVLPLHERTASAAADIEAFLAAEIRRPFDLARGPLFRASLVRLASTRHVLVATVHHMIFDAWSYVIFFRELTALYRAFTAGEQPPLPELPIRYIDFALWQRERLQGETLTRQLRYWTEQLRDAPRLALPADFARPPVQSFRGARVRHVIANDLIADVEAFGRSQGATLYITLLTVYVTLLHRHSGQEQFVIGSPMANRSRQELEPLIGFFLNTLALRLDVSGQPTFRDLLQRVKRTAFAAYGHPDLPFEKLVEELQPERTLSHSPIVETAFVLDNTPGAVGETMAVGDLRLRRRVVDTGTSKFDIALLLFKQDGGRRATLEYALDLFTEQTGATLLRHFERLLREVVSDPDRRIDRLPLLEAGERATLVEDWGTRRAAYPSDRSLPALVEEQARATPDAVAVCDERVHLTYAELNARANQLARHLRAEGIALDDRVGVCLERSAETIVVLLAIVKAGAAYVPLDPANPAERLRALAARGQLRLIVTRRAHAQAFAADDRALLLMEDVAAAIAARPSSNVTDGSTADSLAYVLFTSGSTGEPKPVGVPHRAIVRLAYGMPEIPLGDGARVLQLAPLAFDASTFEIWAPLLRGGCVVVAPLAHYGPSELASLLSAERISVLWLTASLFNTVVDERPSALAGVYLITGGEALSVPHVERALAALPETVVVNGYGPTESTTFATYFVIPRDSVARRVSIPIGRPLANTRIYVLDADREPVPIGVPGELWIGGDGLARGYLDDPALTADRFVTDPFVSDSGARMYRSGDRARFLPDGTLEFLGRLDDQVKIRGYRIEPAEVEAALARHPHVRRAAVTAHDLPALGRSLVAYIVAADPRAVPTTSELRGFLNGVVPSYLVPAVYVAVETLPLTANGKIDRRALPPPAVGDPGAVRAKTARDLTETETIVASVWQQVLAIAHVEADSDFFALGGHSLLATQVISRLSDAFNTPLEVRAIFEAPTIESLAALIDSRPKSAASEPAVLPASPDATAVLSSGQRRLWFLHHWDPTSGSYNVPLTLRLTGALDVKALEQALTWIVQRHEVLRTVFPMVDGQPRPQVLDRPPVPLTRVDASDLAAKAPDEMIRASVAAENRRPFDLARGPLVRAMLLRFSPHEHIVTITMHHIVTDGWSRGVFITELQACYAAARQQAMPALPPLTIQYRDYALWQKQRFEQGALDEQLAFWKAQLPAPHPVLNLPFDYPRPAQLSAEGGHIPLSIGPEVTTQLTAVAQAANATTFMTLLAAFMAMLSHYSGQQEIRVGTPVAGRTRAELEPLIGFFVNTLVIRALFSPDLTFLELLGRVRLASLDAFAHQDLPFERLVDELHPQRTASHAPLFQAMFVLQNAPRPAFELPGLRAEAMTIHGDSAKFDIIFSMSEVANGLQGRCEYARDLFRPETVAEMVSSFHQLIARAAASPDTPVRELLGPRPVRSAPATIPPPTPAPVTLPAASPEIEAALAEIWGRVLGVSEVNPSDNFFDLGGHSLLAVRLFSELETRLGIKLPLATIFRDGTIRGQARLVEQASRPGHWSPLVPIQPSGSRIPFFIVHGIGGEVLSFAPLAQRLGPEQPLYGLQARSDDPERFFSSIESVADTYVRALRRMVPTGPYRLGGYSAGGVIALEMAQQLRRAGQDVALLAVIDCPAPGGRRRHAGWRSPLEMFSALAYWAIDDDLLSSGWSNAGRRVTSRLLRLRDRVQPAVGAAPAAPDIRHTLGVWRYPESSRPFLEAFVTALKAYSPQPYAGRVSLVRSRTGRFGASPRAADLGWGPLAAGGVDVHIVPAAHDTMLTEPRVRSLAEHLTTLLAQVDDGDAVAAL